MLLIKRECEHCGKSLAERHGKRLFCNDNCKRRAYRRRAAGLRADSYPGGAQRGHVPLGQLTAAEQRVRLFLLDAA